MPNSFKFLDWLLIGEMNIPLDCAHKEAECSALLGDEDYCPLHKPSDHGMNTWPMVMRSTALIERVCKHGIGHPDPDSVAWMDKYGEEEAEGMWGIHGCDGCCHDNRVE
jgi:hypothetical protein